MKTYLVLFSFFVFVFHAMNQSQAETYIKEAQTYMATKDYKNAQMSLQDAINDLILMLGHQIAEFLPNEINGLVKTDDANKSGGMNIPGVSMRISKSYRHPTKKENDAEVKILANRPMLAAMNIYLNFQPWLEIPDHLDPPIPFQFAPLIPVNVPSLHG